MQFNLVLYKNQCHILTIGICGKDAHITGCDKKWLQAMINDSPMKFLSRDYTPAGYNTSIDPLLTRD